MYICGIHIVISFTNTPSFIEANIFAELFQWQIRESKRQEKDGGRDIR